MAQEKQKESPVLGPHRMQLSEHARNHWVVDVEVGIPMTQLLDPSFWALNSTKLRPFDLIEARAEDGVYWGLYLVTGCDRTWARVVPILEKNLTTGEVAISQAVGEDRYRVEWKGLQKKACVIRNADGAIIHEGSQSKADAAQWMKDNAAILT